MTLLIGAESVEVLAGGHSVRHIPLAPTARAFGGKMLSAITSTRGYVREWTLQFPLMLIADVEALEAELDGPGSVTVDGSLIDDDNAIVCYARNVQRQTGLSTLWAAVSCELVEDDWTFGGYGFPVEETSDSFSVSTTDDDGLRFRDLTNGRVDVHVSGTLVARLNKIGRFTPEAE